LSQMVDHAGVIALVTVSEVQSTEELDAIPFTNYGVSVDEWIAVSRSDQAKSKEIVVRQLGAIAKDGSVVVADDDPLLIKGERAIVFLREFAPGQFVIQGGPTGRLQIRGGEAHRVGGGLLAATSQPLNALLASTRDELGTGRAKSYAVTP